MGPGKSSPKREIQSITNPPKETGKYKINNLTLRETRKRTMTKSKVSRRKEIMKIRAEINKIESKKYKRSKEPRGYFLKRTRLTNVEPASSRKKREFK